MNRRTFLKTLGAVGAVAVLPVKWVVEQVEPRSIWIVASDSSPAAKRKADVVCTGHNDGSTIQAAIDRLGPGGGNYLLDTPKRLEDFGSETRIAVNLTHGSP